MFKFVARLSEDLAEHVVGVIRVVMEEHEVLHFGVGIIAHRVSTATQPLDIDWNFSLTRWLAVLFLFVLARVFEHGARMREDLEGTV